MKKITFCFLLLSFSIIAKVPTSVTGLVLLESSESQEVEVSVSEFALNWANRYIHGFEHVPENKKASAYLMIDSLKSRIQHWELYNIGYANIYNNQDLEEYRFPIFNNSREPYFEFLDRETSLTDSRHYHNLRGKTIEEVFNFPGDTRVMDLVRADGTRNSVVLKTHRQTEYIQGQWNLFYHEFAHYIHYTLLSTDEFMELIRLYENQKANNSFLDDYAAGHVSEYFATGFEAYFTDTKDNNRTYYKHTRLDILETDPELYRFIESLLD